VIWLKYGKAFLIKILRFTLNLAIFIGLVFNEPYYVILSLIVILAPVTFLIGDVWLLPKLGNLKSLLIDAPLFFCGILAIHEMLGITLGFGHYFLFIMITIALCIEEFMYHNYIERKVLGKNVPSISEMINNL
jgi:hypothetical protein